MSKVISNFDELVNFKIKNQSEELKFIIIFTTNNNVELNKSLSSHMTNLLDFYNADIIQLALINLDNETDLSNRNNIDILSTQLTELPAMMSFENMESNTYNIIPLKELNISDIEVLIKMEIEISITKVVQSTKNMKRLSNLGGFLGRRLGNFFASNIVHESPSVYSKEKLKDDNKLKKKANQISKSDMAFLGGGALSFVKESRKTITIPEGNGNIEDLLLKMLKEQNEFREEVRMNFQKVHNKLEQIHNNLQQEKILFIESVNALINSPETDIRNQELENTLNEADNLLLKYTNKMLENNTKFSTIISKYEFLSHFEDESKNMIRSCFLVYELVQKQQVKEFDYSLCAVGLWKAVEVELNIILIDSIRFTRGLINAVPSNQITLKNGRELVFGGHTRGKEYFVNINNTNNGKLNSVMLGDMSKIARNYKNNDFSNILSQIQIENSAIADLSSFMSSFTSDLNKIIYTYRNECSHTGVLGETEYDDLERLLFNENGLYIKISLLKEKIYSNL